MSRSLTISIVNTKQWDWLKICIDSLLENPYSLGQSEIVVLDNASDDGSVDKISEQFPTVRVIAESTRRGFGENHGIVAESGSTDLVLFLNPDTLMCAGTLDRLVSAFDVDSRVFAAGGPILDFDGVVTRDSPERFPTPWTSLVQAVGLHRLFTKSSAPTGVTTSTGWLSGSALVVDRRAFLSVGGFDPSFFLYFEETDFARRFVGAGGLVAFDSDAPIMHEGRTTERAMSSGDEVARVDLKTTTEFERSGIIFMRKHHGFAGSTLYRLALALSALVRLGIACSPRFEPRLEPVSFSAEAKRRQQIRRIGVAVRPHSGTSIGDTAAVWNHERIARTGS